METHNDHSYSAFLDHKLISSGTLSEITELLRSRKDSAILVFDDLTGRVVDIDLRAHIPPVKKKTTGPGRPKLGVESKEITLLPRHWDWLSKQPGGASVTLRKLVEEAKKLSQGTDLVREAQDATYQFMRVMAGDLAGYEEALRALYAKNAAKFKQLTNEWPKDIQQHIKRLSKAAF